MTTVTTETTDLHMYHKLPIVMTTDLHMYHELPTTP